MKALRLFFLFLVMVLPSILMAQVLPPNRSVDWTLAGMQEENVQYPSTILNIQNFGGVGDGLVVNDTALQAAINQLNGQSGIISFPSGTFLFNSTIILPDSVILRGDGAENTTLKLDLGGVGHGIYVAGGSSSSDTSSMIQSATKDDIVIQIADSNLLVDDDWIQLIQNDSSFIDYTQWPWGLKKVGQVVQVERVDGFNLHLHSPLRMDYPLSRQPYIRKIRTISNVGIECLKIDRIDNTAPSQNSNIQFKYAVNCWVKGIESNKCTYAHVDVRYSSNLKISRSYFHHGHEYGGGGRAYGVMLHSTTGECLVENNVFEHLRHSMIVQSGANGNVFAYNYSWDPFWSNSISNSAGDAVCHGTYPYANLWEHNIVQNIVLDNSHGLNGPYNTFLRNRAATFGIMINATNSPDQNFIGNTVTSTVFLQGFYNLQGSGHFEHGNNHKGAIIPSGTSTLSDLSYAYTSKPEFVRPEQFGSIGVPAGLADGTVPAKQRFDGGQTFLNVCGNFTTPIVSVDTSLTAWNEGDGVVRLPLMISQTNPMSTPVQLSLEWTGGADSTDVQLLSSMIEFPPNNDSIRYIELQLVDDTLQENDEPFVVKLMVVDNGVVTDSTISCTILDNDVSTSVALLNDKFNTIIYPNPSTGAFYIKTQRHVQKIHVYNPLGIFVAENNGPFGPSTISLELNGKSGYYIIHVEYIDGIQERLPLLFVK